MLLVSRRSFHVGHVYIWALVGWPDVLRLAEWRVNRAWLVFAIHLVAIVTIYSLGKFVHVVVVRNKSGLNIVLLTFLIQIRRTKKFQGNWTILSPDQCQYQFSITTIAMTVTSGHGAPSLGCTYYPKDQNILKVIRTKITLKFHCPQGQKCKFYLTIVTIL